MAAAAREFPALPVHSEEHPLADWSSCRELIIVDPLDGTTNFVCGIPFSSVSVAVVRGGIPVAGVVAPLSGGWYFGVSGDGSYFGESLGQTESAERLQCAKRRMDRAILAVTCDQNDGRSRRLWWEWLSKLRPPVCFRLRIVESAAIELCWLACARMDAYLHPSDKPWDVAAGAIIAREAGVKLYSSSLNAWTLATPGIVATTPDVQVAVTDAIRRDRTEVLPENDTRRNERVSGRHEA